MASPAEVEAQVRFALSQLPAQNAHHEFEHICRYLTQQFICTNILPATGPVSAGGDQGRDFETFHSYLREELGAHGAFLGLVSEETVAFTCTIQADDLPRKVKQDIGKICAFGHPVHEIHAFTLKPVPVGSRHRLQDETRETHGVRLELYDAESIANFLARPKGFWIAERFLSIPAEIRPDSTDADGALSAEYVERRRRWRERGSPDTTLGDFIDLKAGLRAAVFRPEVRGDLPFWLGLVRQLLANSECPPHIRQRARYELVVATFRGTGDFQPVDSVARAYLDESLDEAEPVLLQDASALLMYANTAVREGLTSLTPAELEDWNSRLTRRIRDLISHETPHRRATLLFTLGQLGLHPALTEADIQVPSDEAHMMEVKAWIREPSTFASASLSDDLVLVDVSRTLSTWTELMETLDETPLFPIQTLADMLQMLVPLWSHQQNWRELLDRVDEAVGERSGKHVLAARAGERAMKLLKAGRRLDALEELHQAKIDWWSGGTARGSLLAMIIAAELYLELRLPQASKSYALAVAYIAERSRDEKLADLVPAGLLMAASADFIAGAWCSATDLYVVGLGAQHEFIEAGLESEEHTRVDNALLHLAYISACAGNVDSDFAALIEAMSDRIGALEIIEGATVEMNSEDKDFWESFGGAELTAWPFADLGESRYIRFSALGTDWTLVSDNDMDSVYVAERFAAAAQVILAALAREDLCLVHTRINVRIENSREVESHSEGHIESLPSNDGQKWVVRLSSVRNSDNANPEEVNIELLTMLTTILREASLLPEADFSAGLERAFARGLGHKLLVGRPYDELAERFTSGTELEIARSQFDTPWEGHDRPHSGHDELRWQDRQGPTYSPDRASELLHTRYSNLAKSLRITVAMLATSEEFRLTVKTLRAAGWLDWHILAAIFNIVINYRFPVDRFNLHSEETPREMKEVMSQPERATAEPVPVGLFTPDAMNDNRQFSMLSLLNHWGLECQQRTPDISAIERLLAGRYGYWDEDVPHEDPFPDSGKTENSGRIVVMRDLTQ